MKRQLLGTLARYGWKDGIHKNNLFVDADAHLYLNYEYFVVTDATTWGTTTRPEAVKVWAKLRENK